MHRIEIRLKADLPDVRGLSLIRDINDLGIASVNNIRVVDIYWLDADLTPHTLKLICRCLLADPVTQEYWYGQCSRPNGEAGIDYHSVEVAYNAGVTDPVEGTIIKALKDLGVAGVRGVKTAKRYLIEGQLDQPQLDAICSKLLVNPDYPARSQTGAGRVSRKSPV